MKIVPMEKDSVLARCIHCGPFSLANIEEMRSSEPALSEEQFERNKQFLTRMIDAYGSCGMLAVDGDLVVAHARFYPQAICDQCQFCCRTRGLPSRRRWWRWTCPPSRIGTIGFSGLIAFS